MGADFVYERAELVRSMTLIDTTLSTKGAFPIWALEVPVVREVVLGVSFIFAKMVGLCCSERVGVITCYFGIIPL